MKRSIKTRSFKISDRDLIILAALLGTTLSVVGTKGTHVDRASTEERAYNHFEPI